MPTSEKAPPIPFIPYTRFLRVFKDSSENQSESRFCFIIGSGASVKSDIRSGAALSKQWIEELENDMDDEAFQQWVKNSSIDIKQPAEFYGQIYQKRFEHDAKTGHETLIKEMEKAKASIGYPLFASFLADDRHNHNIVITTNFDSLIESSVYRYTNKQPLVIGHENLAHFLSTSSKRPIIAKIHRDLLLDPKSKTDDISTLPEEWKTPLQQIFQTSKVIVIGYGGNDGSLMNFLTDHCPDIPNLFWCVRKDNPNDANANISGKVRNLLRQTKGKLASIQGFDEFMFDLSDIYDSDNLLDKDKPENSKMVEEARQRATEFQQQIDDMDKQTVESEHPTRKTKHRLSSDWLETYRKIEAITDPVEKKQKFLKAIQTTPHPYLHDIFAQFLVKQKKYIEADTEYEKAKDLSPNDPIILGNYANFLANHQHHFQQAEKYYLKSINADPNNTSRLSNYALFIQKHKQDFEQAETFHLKAIKADPKQANTLGNYAGFLFINGRTSEGIEHLDRAFQNLKTESLTEVLKLELCFYEYAHLPNRLEKAQDCIETLLEAGIDSAGFDLSLDVQKAIENGHPDPEKLQQFATRISKL